MIPLPSCDIIIIKRLGALFMSFWWCHFLLRLLVYNIGVSLMLRADQIPQVRAEPGVWGLQKAVIWEILWNLQGSVSLNMCSQNVVNYSVHHQDHNLYLNLFTLIFFKFIITFENKFRKTLGWSNHFIYWSKGRRMLSWCSNLQKNFFNAITI